MEVDLRRLQLGIKRLFDTVTSLVVLIVGSPLFVVTATLVKVSSPGPIFFVQERIGKDGRPFQILKFRSMTIAPPEGRGRLWNETEGARITPIGRFLRDYGLDELPQFLNILRGEMSIVGPRPPIPVRVKDYTVRQRKVFQMRPGLVSLAIVKGRRSIPMEERIELHLEYVKNWSLWLDWVILARSVVVVLCRQNADEVITG